MNITLLGNSTDHKLRIVLLLLCLFKMTELAGVSSLGLDMDG